MEWIEENGWEVLKKETKKGHGPYRDQGRNSDRLRNSEGRIML
jgi:hypothetical protein